MFKIVGVLIAAAVAGTSMQSPQTSLDSDGQRDMYAIYSMVMANPPKALGTDTNRFYFIVSETKPAKPTASQQAYGLLNFLSSPSDCVTMPQGYETRWSEVTAAFKAGTDAPVNLKNELDIKKPYVFLSAEGAMTVRGNPGFFGVKDIFSLTNVYFDMNRSLAVVGISGWCGGKCGFATWQVFEKGTDRTWKEVVPGKRCQVFS